MTDWRLSSGTDEARQADRDHASGRYRDPPVMERVTLRGGPLDGLVRHVRRSASRVRFQKPLGDGKYWYVRDHDNPGVWRYEEPKAVKT